MSGSDDIIIGIDLGTTFSMVAYLDERGPQVIRDESGDARVPSVLRIQPDGRTLVGWSARNSAVEHPEETVYSVKRLMGIGAAQLQRELPFLAYRVGSRPDAATGLHASPSNNVGDDAPRDLVAVELNGQWLTPQEISARLLTELRQRAERHLERRVRRAVITVPAYFDDSQRQATRDAGQIAGLEVVRIVNEPTAAALAYGIGARQKATPAKGSDVQTGNAAGGRSLPIGDKSKCSGEDGSDATNVSGEASTVAVYDLGGGTFDVSVLRLEDGVFEVLGTHGNTHLGGDDFDRAIVTLVQREVKERFGLDIQSPQTRQALRLFAEQVKIKLSDDVTARIELDLGEGRLYQREITRDEFEALIAPFIDESIKACKTAVRAAQVKLDEIDRIVMVGGSTRIPLVRRRVSEYFGRELYTALNPDEVVAMGAAVQAGILAGSRRDLLLLDVTPLSLGIETMGGAVGKLIMANTRIPSQATEMFTTFVEGQTNVKINVLQGERELAKDCRLLGSFDLRGIPPMPAGIPKIQVSFLIDANGILNVSALEERSGKAAQIQVVPAHGLTADEVRQATLDATRFAREDMTAHRLIDLRNQVAFDTAKVEQALAGVGDLLGVDERERILTEMADLRRMAESTNDADVLHRALDRFDKGTLRLAELNIAEALKRS